MVAICFRLKHQKTLQTNCSNIHKWSHMILDKAVHSRNLTLNLMKCAVMNRNLYFFWRTADYFFLFFSYKTHVFPNFSDKWFKKTGFKWFWLLNRNVWIIGSSQPQTIFKCTLNFSEFHFQSLLHYSRRSTVPIPVEPSWTKNDIRFQNKQNVARNISVDHNLLTRAYVVYFICFVRNTSRH